MPKACGTRIKTRVIKFPNNTGNMILLVACFPFIFNVSTLHIAQMHSFSVASLTNNHTLSGLKQHKFTILHF